MYEDEMDALEMLKAGDLQDCWSIIYEELAKPIYELGVDGEAALREGIRNYGIQRGTDLRKKHQGYGLKLNMLNLFTYYDLPNDPRFKREKVRLDTEARLSHTTVCPDANKWIEDGNKWLGRIYCEEFHHACFGAYNSHTQTNLAKTITQDGDNYCRFSVYLRPANMNAEERKEAFEQFDPDYKAPENFVYDLPGFKDGFNRLAILLFYHIPKVAMDTLGEAGKAAAAKGMDAAFDHLCAFLHERAEAQGERCDAGFIKEHCPMDVDPAEDKLWDTLPDHPVKQLVKERYYARTAELCK